MENFKPLQVDFEVLRRSRNKGEEKEERLGQLTHWEGLEGDRGVKKNFRTLHVWKSFNLLLRLPEFQQRLALLFKGF